MVKEITVERLQEALGDFLWNIYDDIIPLIPDHTVEIDLSYDPSEWFTDEDTRMGNFVSGRLFCLAHTGVLQAMGFRVEGTGLPTVEEDGGQK